MQVGPFPWDEDGNCYLLVAVDPFSKWVETHAMPLLHSWRAAEFLYDDLVAHWGKPCYVWTDNGTEFAGSFAHSSVKGWALSTTTSLLVIVKPMGR